jgi:hypothetical protein
VGKWVVLVVFWHVKKLEDLKQENKLLGSFKDLGNLNEVPSTFKVFFFFIFTNGLLKLLFFKLEL